MVAHAWRLGAVLKVYWTVVLEVRVLLGWARYN
jgi:hypothetical protein